MLSIIAKNVGANLRPQRKLRLKKWANATAAE
jgi:hypothetical protein